MNCWKCGDPQEPPPNGKLPFRAICDGCSMWLHCCKNCTHYKQGLPNDCTVPGTEQVADREGCNFCDEFALLGEGPKTAAKPENISDRLFGKSEGETSSKKNFNDLFKD